LALIFDFDDTLVPDSTTLLLEHYKIDPKRFWLQDAKRLVESGYDPAHAYLKLLLDNIGHGRRLGNLTNRGLAGSVIRRLSLDYTLDCESSSKI
jgi:hypothetical protein